MKKQIFCVLVALSLLFISSPVYSMDWQDKLEKDILETGDAVQAVENAVKSGIDHDTVLIAVSRTFDHLDTAGFCQTCQGSCCDGSYYKNMGEPCSSCRTTCCPLKR